MALTREAVVESALRLGDAEGLDAVTIRRLAQELGVTPMALYWHFKNKDLLFIGMIDELMADVCVDLGTDPWLAGVRGQVDALVAGLRAHPYMPELFQLTEKIRSENFARATEAALTFLTRGGFPLGRAYQVASYLLQASCALVANQPCPVAQQLVDPGAWLHQMRLGLSRYPSTVFPLLNAYSEELVERPDLDDYYGYGVELIMASIETMAAREP
ncbi:TetR/AcrR family transcriptional regulator [Actinocorallia longicatena]|uniref:HTH tetR-type domain-containing protein n=1 Tax=Actinocorallia longicatena TaxID=111803 RepID=A0ABP6Q1H5_9ACTN